MNLRSRRLWVPAAIVAAIAIFLVTRDGGVPVETAAATRDSLSVSVGVEGRTRAIELFTVAAPVSGRLTRIEVDEGAQVEQGEVIARILPTQENPRTVLALQAEVEAARAASLEAESGVADVVFHDPPNRGDRLQSHERVRRARLRCVLP